MITVINTKDGFRVWGHADFAPHGQDIVCAGVSALAQAVAVVMQDRFGAKVEKYSGYISVQCNPYSGYDEDDVENVFWAGIKPMAEQFPQYIQIIEEEKTDDKN